MALTHVSPDEDGKTLAKVVEEAVGKFPSLRKAAQFYGLNPGLLHYVLKEGGDSVKVRRAFGLPMRRVQVEACPDCGEGHTVGWCVKSLGEPKRPRRPRVLSGNPKRISIQKTNPVLAARAIRKHMTAEDIAALVEELSQ